MTGRRELPIALDDAVARVLAEAGRLGTEPVDLADALGRTLADDVCALDPVPSFDNSAMDGFALIAADTSAATEGSPAALGVVGESRAGHPFGGPPLTTGGAIRISTGAAMPAGADAVVRVEVAAEDESASTISLLEPVAPGAEVRRAGEDMEAGQVVVPAGSLLGAGEIGACAGAGAERPEVVRRPRVSVLATGDELVPAGTTLDPGMIRNSNGPALAAAAIAAGANVVAVDHVPDDPDATERAVAAAVAGSDLVLISGGVSVGPHDHVKPALDACGVEQRFWRVALKPGKPTWFGVAADEPRCLVLGLAGNPVSTLVGFELFARPALAKMLGRPWHRAEVEAVAEMELSGAEGRTEVVRLRARRDGERWLVRPTGAQGSHVSSSMVGVDALAFLEPGREPIRPGDRLIVQLLPGALLNGD